MRHAAPKKLNEDIVVPVSKLQDYIQSCSLLSEKYNIPIVNFGHAGNGNLHANLLFDPDNEDEHCRAKRCLDSLFSMVVELGGSISGEHGIGIEKKEFISKEVPATELNLMRSIKKVFDPLNLLNPDKIF